MAWFDTSKAMALVVTNHSPAVQNSGEGVAIREQGWRGGGAEGRGGYAKMLRATGGGGGGHTCVLFEEGILRPWMGRWACPPIGLEVKRAVPKKCER